jgi:hypothetical protein
LVKPADNDELVAEVFRVITESQANRATTDQKALGGSVPETNSSVAAAGR